MMVVRFWKKALKWAFEVLQPHQKRANFSILSKPAAAAAEKEENKNRLPAP